MTYAAKSVTAVLNFENKNNLISVNGFYRFVHSLDFLIKDCNHRRDNVNKIPSQQFNKNP